jgi:hypothetical protein
MFEYKKLMMIVIGASMAGCLAPPDEGGETAGTEALASAPGDIHDDALLHRNATSRAELRQQVQLQLQLFPGGVQIDENEVAYQGGAFVMTFALPEQAIRPRATADCPSGWFCFYDHANFGYPRGKLSDHGWQDLGPFGWSDRTESVHNNTTTRVEFDNHVDFGDPANGHTFDELDIFGADAHTTLSTVSRPNTADHVFRF